MGVFVDGDCCCGWCNYFSNIMKSQEQADATYKNACNRSSAKYQYSFGKEQRFKQRVLKTEILDKFYDLPSQISRRGAIFGRDKRDCDRPSHIESVPSWNYNPKEAKSSGTVVFAPGREACKHSSAFYTTTVDYPGPGKYNPDRPQSKSQMTLAGRPQANYSTISPGPKYNFESTLLDRNKILSQEKRKGSCRIVLPSNKSRLVMSDASDSQGNIKPSATESLVTRKGNKMFGQSGSRAIMPRETRFKSEDTKKQVPGPGHYTQFSQFIQSKHS